MNARLFPILLSLGLVAMSGVTAAKSLSRIIAETGLSPADFEVLSASSTALLSTGTPAVGQEEAWQNAETGSKGTIRVFEARDNCVGLQHFIQPNGGDEIREIRTRRCQDGNGNWVLTP